MLINCTTTFRAIPCHHLTRNYHHDVLFIKYHAVLPVHSHATIKPPKAVQFAYQRTLTPMLPHGANLLPFIRSPVYPPNPIVPHRAPIPHPRLHLSCKPVRLLNLGSRCSGEFRRRIKSESKNMNKTSVGSLSLTSGAFQSVGMRMGPSVTSVTFLVAPSPPLSVLLQL